MNDTGKLILRLALGVLILLHGISKLSSGIDGITSMVTADGLPALVAYGVYIGEVLAPLMVIAGWYSRIGAGIVAINMLFAVGLVHRADVFAFAESAGRWSCRACSCSLRWRSPAWGLGALVSTRGKARSRG
jgi:putative oxidoreductase